MLYSSHLCLPRLSRFPALGFETSQPRGQRTREVVPAYSSARHNRTRRPEVIAMLRIRNDISKQSVLSSLHSAFRLFLRYNGLGREWLRARWRQCTPRIKFAIGPVCV
jgi:hypothetical protein